MLFLLDYVRISSALTVLVLCEMQGQFINWARPRENLESRVIISTFQVLVLVYIYHIMSRINVIYIKVSYI